MSEASSPPLSEAENHASRRERERSETRTTVFLASAAKAMRHAFKLRGGRILSREREGTRADFALLYRASRKSGLLPSVLLLVNARTRESLLDSAPSTLFSSSSSSGTPPEPSRRHFSVAVAQCVSRTSSYVHIINRRFAFVNAEKSSGTGRGCILSAFVLAASRRVAVRFSAST